MAYETIQIETHGAVGLIRLDRPKALNALNFTLMREVVAASQAFDADNAIGAIVITGSTRAFAAGADIKDMQTYTYADAYLHDL
jgi:enoyl-CoA hydratase